MDVSPKTAVREIVSMSAEMAAEINDYRFKGRFPSKAEAMRALLRAGLDAAKEEG